jgi:type IV secretory pathway VirB2 component (pilin)
MFITISYINLFLLLSVSTCHIVIAIIYYNQCPISPYLSITLIITGILGVILSIIALIIHCFDTYDGSNKWNLLLTYILFIYLLGSRIATSIMAFRLASRPYNQSECASVLYWTSTLLIVVSYSIIVITCCVLINLIILRRKHNKYQKPVSTL